MASCGTFWGFLAPSGTKLSEESFMTSSSGNGWVDFWHRLHLGGMGEQQKRLINPKNTLSI